MNSFFSCAANLHTKEVVELSKILQGKSFVEGSKKISDGTLGGINNDHIIDIHKDI